MKKILGFGLSVLFIGCASTPSAVRIADLSKTAVISINSNTEVTWYGEEKESKGLLDKLIEKKTGASVSEKTSQILPIAESTLREKLTAKGLIVMDPAAVLKSTSYLSAKEDKMMKMSDVNFPEGYKSLSYRDTKTFGQIAVENNLKSGIYASFDFKKIVSTGVEKNGVAKACVTMTVFIVNDIGKTILQKSFYAASDDTFVIVSGVYNPNTLMALFPDAINKVCDKFVGSLTNM